LDQGKLPPVMCDGYILAVTKNAVTNSAVMLAVWLVGGFRISPAASKL